VITRPIAAGFRSRAVRICPDGSCSSRKAISRAGLRAEVPPSATSPRVDHRPACGFCNRRAASARPQQRNSLTAVLQERTTSAPRARSTPSESSDSEFHSVT